MFDCSASETHYNRRPLSFIEEDYFSRTRDRMLRISRVDGLTNISARYGKKSHSFNAYWHFNEYGRINSINLRRSRSGSVSLILEINKDFKGEWKEALASCYIMPHKLQNSLAYNFSISDYHKYLLGEGHDIVSRFISDLSDNWITEVDRREGQKSLCDIKKNESLYKVILNIGNLSPELDASDCRERRIIYKSKTLK